MTTYQHHQSRANKATTYAILMILAALLAAPFLFMISIALASDETTVKLAFTFIPHEGGEGTPPPPPKPKTKIETSTSSSENPPWDLDKYCEVGAEDDECKYMGSV